MSNNEKLDQLRAKYAGVGGGVVCDPTFKRVAELQFKDGEKRVWPGPTPRPCSMPPTGPMLPSCRTSPGSTSR